MDDDDFLKPDPRRLPISINELPDEEQAAITNRIFRQINLLTTRTNEGEEQNTKAKNESKSSHSNYREYKVIEVVLSPQQSEVSSSIDNRELSATTIATTRHSAGPSTKSTTDALGIGKIKNKIDKSLPRRKTPGEVYRDCALELQFFFGLYEIFIEQSMLCKKPPRSMIPYKLRAPGELPHPSINNALRFEINSRHYRLMMAGEEKELGLSKIIHLNSFLMKCYDYSGVNMFSVYRPLTWINFFFGAVFFGNEIEITNSDNDVVGKIQQVRGCNVALSISDVNEDRIMCVKTNICVSRFGFVRLDNCVMKFYDWDDELLYATLVFKGTYSRKKFWNYEKCIDSISMLKFDVEVHPIWKICILATYFFLFRNYLEERRPIFMGAGIVLIIILFVTILLICSTISITRQINTT